MDFPVITALSELRQEHHCDFECSLGYIVNSLLVWVALRSCLKTNKQKDGDKNQSPGRRERKEKGRRRWKEWEGKRRKKTEKRGI